MTGSLMDPENTEKRRAAEQSPGVNKDTMRAILLIWICIYATNMSSPRERPELRTHSAPHLP